MTTLSESNETVTGADTPSVDADETGETLGDQPDTARTRRRIGWSRLLVVAVLPGFALALTLASGYFAWLNGSADAVAVARAESVQAASDAAVALLSYRADSVDKDLGAASERLTGDFKAEYTTLTRQVVIPGAKEKHISASAKVTAAASVSAAANRAAVLLFVNQTVTIGQGAPTDTHPVIRVKLDKVGGRWLVSHFDPA